MDGALLQNMLEIAAELALQDPAYLEMTLKFIGHFIWIASAMTHLGSDDRECGTRRTASSMTCSDYPTVTLNG